MSGGVGHMTLTSQEKHEKFQEKNEEFQENQPPLEEKPTLLPPTKNPPPLRRRQPFLSLRQLNMLAVIVVLAASGMVAAGDFIFVMFSFVYMYFISKVAFPTLSPAHSPPVFGENNRLLGIYVAVGAVIGLVLPVVYIIEGILEGDKEGIKAATPHVFLLASQVFMEGVAFSDWFSIPIRVFVPVVYNSARMYSLLEWLNNEFSKGEEGYHGSSRRLLVGRVLAIANLVFWSFNLFGFLLPVYLPRAFKKYYEA